MIRERPQKIDAKIFHMMQITGMSRRIRYWRKQRRMTLEQLAAQLGTSAGHLHKWETGKVSVNLKRLGEIAGILGVSIVDLVEDLPRVPVVGRVGAGALVESIDDFPLGEGRRSAQCPTGLDPQNTVAVEVVGDSMLPIDEGWLLFYSRNYDGVPTECLGKLCVVQLADAGTRYVKRLKAGRSAGLFNLYSTNAREIEDVALAWAAPVLHARPAEPDELVEE
jgi:repressor LexA